MFAVFAFAVVILYVLLISQFIKGWDELPDFETDKMPFQTPVTIITAFRNEEINLPSLAKALDNQTYQNFEWILVNDHSTDYSEGLMNEIIEQGMFGVKVMNNKGKGKKEAIRTAIYEAKNELMITLDADVILQPDWLLNIVSYQEKFPSDLLICPVKMEKDHSFWGKFQQFEFASLVASGAGATKKGMPILCNGANLAFKKSAWLKSEQKLRFKEPSGDDIYLLQAIKRKHGVIRFLKSKKAMVETKTSKTQSSFLRQRTRWAGKRAMYADWELLMTALLVFLSSATIITTAILIPFLSFYSSLFCLLFLAKLAIDTLFFYKIKDFFELKNVLINSFIFSVIYPFYIVLTAFGSLFRGKKW